MSWYTIFNQFLMRYYDLYTDASDIGTEAACLSTIDEDGVERQIRKLPSAKLRYLTVEKRTLGGRLCSKKIAKVYIGQSIHIVLYCDNTAVCYMFNKDKPSQRLQRWVLCTQECSFKIIHLPFRKNAMADAL